MIFDWVVSKFKKEPKSIEKIDNRVMSTDRLYPVTTEAERRDRLENALAKSFQREVKPIPQFDSSGKQIAMDSSNLKSSMLGGIPNFGSLPSIISDVQIGWYASQGFIGHQACAIIAQHWMVNKACTIPAEDAIRNGYDVTVNNGYEVDEEVLDEIRKKDKEYHINNNMLQFVRQGRIFGIRVAIFKIESNDPEYYEKPFNIDGITSGSYKGISQVDPYWMAPELDSAAVTDPSSMDFYVPTYWNISGVRYHRSHLVIMKNYEVADILKPTYFYGGIPVPQMIYERIYAAERCANEAPKLMLTKRSVTLKTDLTQAISKQAQFESKIAFTTHFMDNYGSRVIDTKDTLEHIDTNLSDIDNIIMTQYQLVAAIAGVPADKLIETAPKGFNATGEYQQKNYHESLESIQAHYLTPLLERHHAILIRSEICPKFNIQPFETTVVWSALNSVDAKEQAEINKLAGETAAGYIAAGVIDGEDARKTLINNPDSGYSGLDSDKVPEPEQEEGNLEDLERPFKDG